MPSFSSVDVPETLLRVLKCIALFEFYLTVVMAFQKTCGQFKTILVSMLRFNIIPSRKMAVEYVSMKFASQF